MNIDTLKEAHALFLNKNLTYYTDLFCDDILNDTVCDCASIDLKANEEGWNLHYVRTQTGWFNFDQDEQETILIDEYNKKMNHDELYMYIQLHGLQSDFEGFIELNQ
jgi:hypothetical protein